jgi:Raf kinase inhibitor-like YbhB/YbcL family protein
MSFLLKSTAFESGGRIPRQYSCDGKDISPPLVWTGVPDKTASLVLVVNDPDAPRGDWVHWVLYDMPGSRRDLPEHVPAVERIDGGGVQGLNDFGKLGWGGPCPPSGMHEYVFTLYALFAPLELEPRATRDEVIRKCHGRVLGQARLTGKYARGRETRI